MWPSFPLSTRLAQSSDLLVTLLPSILPHSYIRHPLRRTAQSSDLLLTLLASILPRSYIRHPLRRTCRPSSPTASRKRERPWSRVMPTKCARARVASPSAHRPLHTPARGPITSNIVHMATGIRHRYTSLPESHHRPPRLAPLQMAAVHTTWYTPSPPLRARTHQAL